MFISQMDILAKSKIFDKPLQKNGSVQEFLYLGTFWKT